MKRELQIGDRVSWYECGKSGPDLTNNGRRFKGVIKTIEGDTAYVDAFETFGRLSWVHLKQLRRLLPRKKPCPPQGERVEHWAEVDGKGRGIAYYHGGEAERFAKGDLRDERNRVVRLLEIRPNEVLIDASTLRAAIIKCFGYDRRAPECDPAYIALAAALGLEGGK